MEQFGPPNSRSSGQVSLTILIAMVVSASTTAGLYFSMQSKSKVPALVGLTLADAQAKARTAGLTVVVSGKSADSLIPRGSVAAQVPLAGSPPPEGQVVAVTVSEGAAETTAASPAVTTRAESAPAPPTPVVSKPSPTAPTPSPALARRSASTASAAEVVVPKVTGVRLVFTRSRLKRVGLKIGARSYVTDEDRMDTTVMKQHPRPGTRVPLGTTIRLTINRLED